MCTRVDESRLRLVAADEMYRFPFYLQSYRNDMNWQRGEAYLQKLGLSAYTYGDEFMIGLAQNGIHPHDRWLFYTAEVDMRRLWVRVGAEAADSRSNTADNVLDTLEDIDGDAADAADKLEHVVPHAGRYTLAQAMLIGAAYFTDFDKITRADLGLKLNYHEAHNLLYHWDEWIAAHPEAQGMPRELVLRMHGLGGLLDLGDRYRVPPEKTLP